MNINKNDGKKKNVFLQKLLKLNKNYMLYALITGIILFAAVFVIFNFMTLVLQPGEKPDGQLNIGNVFDSTGPQTEKSFNEALPAWIEKFGEAETNGSAEIDEITGTAAPDYDYYINETISAETGESVTTGESAAGLTGYYARTYENGDKYEGNYIDGRRDGRGTYTWANGVVYIGEFVNGNPSGNGEYVYPPAEPVPEEFIFKKLVSFPPSAPENQLESEDAGPPARIIPPSAGEDGEKIIALTFDDGPGKYTERLLEILAENNAAATFFVVGSSIANYARCLKTAIDIGCEVAGHSWSHPQLTKLNGEDIKWQLQATNIEIFNVTGVYPKIYRPPYGSYNDRVKSVSQELGLSLINWSVDPYDWRVRNADKVYSHIMTNIKNGSIVLCHDIHGTTVEAMERIIPELVEDGFTLVTVSELLQTVEPGELYLGR